MRTPRLSIGLPVYNGAQFIAQSLNALLGQSFEDFELIISDNASTDETGDICEQYSKADSRVKYFRQPKNIGLSPNHNFTLDRASGELFKWASHDDLYARDLLKFCVAALDDRPEIVLAHSWSARIDAHNRLIEAEAYPLATAAPSPSQRFRSMLFDSGGDDDYGVIRTAVLRQVKPNGSYYHAGRTLVSEIALRGPFYHVPQYLYFRRHHAEQAEFKYQSVRRSCTNMDPRRANRLRHPVIRLWTEYAWGYVTAVNRTPLSGAERAACYAYLAEYLVSRLYPNPSRRLVLKPGDDVRAKLMALDITSLVAGLEKNP
jgi:glycosyltransferase involved in cell wall biosynthesis